MNRLSTGKRVQILNMLVEGSSLRSISRVADVSITTLTKLLVDAGTVCQQYHDANVRGINAQRIQCDEIWSFSGSEERNVSPENKGVLGYGEVWTWTAIEADSKLICAYRAGSRDADCALAFIDDLRGRIVNRVKLTTDAHKTYLSAVEEAFSADVDFAMLVKLYEEAPGASPERRCNPAQCIVAEKCWIAGDPVDKDVSNSYVERETLTMRMGMPRFTRPTNAFSKKLENHVHALALYFMHYNFCRIHKTIETTPALQAGITDRLWSMADIAALIEANERKPAKRGPYKKRVQISD